MVKYFNAKAASCRRRLPLTKSNMCEILEPAAKTLAESTPTVKACTKCGVEKPITDFHSAKNSKFGRHSHCKQCRSVDVCAYYRRDEVKQRLKVYRQRPEVKSRLRAGQRDYFSRPDVKEYQQKRRHLYYQRKEVRERRQSYMKAYVERPDVKARLRNNKKLYMREQLRENPAVRLRMNLCARIRLAVKGKNKSARTLELVGCDIGFLRRWIEAKWKPGMSWQNYGKWHVDHIMPCAMFDLSDPVQQRTCFRWTNLQPLWAADNISKSDKIT